MELKLDNGIPTTGVTYELGEVTEDGASGDLQPGGGNIFISVDGYPVGSLWVHLKDGKPVITLGGDPGEENGGWEPVETLPLLNPVS